MSGRGKRIAIFGAVAVGVVGIAGSAMGAGSSSSSSFLNDFARRLGVSPSKVQSAYKGAMADRLNELVKEGKITRQQAQQMQKHLQDHHGGFGFGGPGGPMGGGGFGPRMHGGGFGGPMRGGMSSWLKPATAYLGITTAELQKELMAGKTPAQIATAHGKTAAGLEAVLVAEAKKPLANAVSSGKLTSAQAARIEKFLSERIDDLVQHGFRFRHFGDTHGGWGGPPPSGSGKPGSSDGQGQGDGANTAQAAFGV